MNEQLQNIINDIAAANFTRDELKQLNGAVVTAMRDTERAIATNFSVGQRVTFDSRSGNTIVGTVTKVNLKSIKLKTDGDGLSWKVSPSLLRAA